MGKSRNEYDFISGVQDKTNKPKTYFFILIKIEPFQFITIFYYHTAMAVDPRHKQQAYHSLFGYKQKLREYVSQQIDLSIYIDENEDLMQPNAYQEIRQMLISLQQGNGELCNQVTARKEKMYSLIHAENWEIDAYIKKMEIDNNPVAKDIDSIAQKYISPVVYEYFRGKRGFDCLTGNHHNQITQFDLTRIVAQQQQQIKQLQQQLTQVQNSFSEKLQQLEYFIECSNKQNTIVNETTDLIDL